MPRIEATPTPSLLSWARKSAGLTVEAAAKKLSIKSEVLNEWEAGSSRPSIPQLRKLAATYKRPLAAFYLAEPPLRFDVMHDFRSGTPDRVPIDESPELSYEIRRAYDRREWALELSKEINEEPSSFSFRLRATDDIEEAAGQFRRQLGVTVSAQSTWRVDSEAFRQWRLLFEGHGILTFQATTIPLREARGFSISKNPFPVVVTNIKDAPRGRIFTLLHEAAHLSLNEGGVCDMHDEAVEALCNRFAGAVLFPRLELLSSSVVRNHSRKETTWSDDELQMISRQFGGSREAALVRLMMLGLTTRAFYRTKREEFLEEYELLRKRNKEKGGFAPPHQIAISSAGPYFTGLVVENLRRERITASDVSDYLQIRMKHIPEVQRDFSV